ncbi:transposase [Bacillus sp. DNRA2]|uniref:transposase n=1 Tax=Bacillus sp. DNRA2 TaxID=2723053 RepID=UPI002006DA91|nr:transposase [Bacillus sp. DNRA2]
MLRGINRQTIFEDDEDRRKFLETLKKYRNISKYELYGYCLMDNHVHLLMKESEETISDAIKRISSSYVHWYNMKYERCGHLFQDRFKSENVENHDYFKIALRYIHQNPMKAGLARNVFESKWTSINEYLKKAILVDVDVGFGLFSYDRKSAINMFILYMNQSNGDQCLDDYIINRKSDQEVREYLNQLGIINTSTIQRMERGARDEVLSKLKKLNGVSVRQLSRITGISKSVIDRVRR